MSMQTRNTGRQGEELAEQFLIQQGYQILERNWQKRGGEIDIIAEDNGMLVFVEVKTRRSHARGYAVEGVHKGKQRLVSKTAQLYRLEKKRVLEDCRFDVVSIEWTPTGPRIELFKHAFDAPGDLAWG